MSNFLKHIFLASVLNGLMSHGKMIVYIKLEIMYLQMKYKCNGFVKVYVKPV